MLGWCGMDTIFETKQNFLTVDVGGEDNGSNFDVDDQDLGVKELEIGGDEENDTGEDFNLDDDKFIEEPNEEDL